ncbi:MAG: pilus assembly protein TadC [Bdellovibrio sp. CG10_big_fil_rev_8_21_14_0_10_47_8]|nr:MAG: pilus assembly protein TadC [Bdellovibrio sp. CG10_big_fil_rev_8_21_14_0_10_47_8]
MGSAEFLLVGGLFTAAFAVYSFVSSIMSRDQAEKDILSWASGNEPVKSKSALVNWSRPLVHQFTLKYAIKYKNVRYRKRVEKLILTSGLSRELNVDEFIGMQIFLGLMVPLLLGVMNFTLELGFPWPLFVALVPFGAYLPQIHANREKRARETSVRADLPFFTDLLALSTEAGLDFIGAIQRIVDKAETSVLAEELGNVLRDIKLGSSRAEALKGMAARLDISEITSFVAVLIDADATGASIAQVLKDQSVQIRLDRFVRAEKAGARASQLMLFPMMLFIMPAVFLVLLGPVIVQFVYGGNSN